jgi:hypothetical protein
MVERRPWVSRRQLTTLETTEVSENTGDENLTVLIALGRFPPSCVGCYVVHGQADSIQTKAKSKQETDQTDAADDHRVRLIPNRFADGEK